MCRHDSTWGKSQARQWESRTVPECREHEGDDYRIHRRGDSRWEGYRGSNEIRFLRNADYQGRTMREGSAKKNRYGKSRNGRTNINMEGQRNNAVDEGETSESFGVPDSTIRSGDLDNEKTWQKEDRRFRVVVLGKSTERIMDGEKDTHMDHREHQTWMDTRVNGDKATLGTWWEQEGWKMAWCSGEWMTRKRGRPRQRWLDTLKWYSSGAAISNIRRNARDRAGWRGAATAVARGRMRLDGTIWQMMWNQTYMLIIA